METKVHLFLCVVLLLSACTPAPTPFVLPPDVTNTAVPKPTTTGTAVIVLATNEPSNSVTPLSTPTAVLTPTITSLPTEITDAKGATMRLVPAGEFTMGSENGNADEKPVHKVTLPDYYMDVFEVTIARYKACVEAGICTVPKNTIRYDNISYANHPVVYVNWNQAKTYCEWRGAKLPTEAEWEKAARGTDGRTYPWGEGIYCGRVNYSDCNQNATAYNNNGDTTPVGSYESGKSPYGMYDMAGNVWEWVADWYDANYYATLEENAFNPQGPSSGLNRVLRGGGFAHPDGVRSTDRSRNDPISTDVIVGFRCARTP